MRKRLLNIDAVAHYLHTSPEAIRRLVRQGDVPYVNHEGHLFFLEDELDSWASRHILARDKKVFDTFATAHAGNELFLPSDFLPTENIIAELPSRTKPAVLRDLVAAAESRGLLYDPVDLLHSLEEREKLCSTALPGGVAIVHPRNHDPYLAADTFLILARSTNRIFFGAPDDHPTDIFFLFVCLDERRHLHALARLCMLFTRTTLLDDLRAAENEEEMRTMILKAESGVLK